MSAPTEPGWYWARAKRDDAPWEVVRVTNWGGDIGQLCLERNGSFTRVFLHGWAAEFDWGPRIPEPGDGGALKLMANTKLELNGYRLVTVRNTPGVTVRKGLEADAAALRGDGQRVAGDLTRAVEKASDGIDEEPLVECLQCGGRWLSGEPERHYEGCSST